MRMLANIERNLAARVHADLDVAGVVDFLKLTQEQVEGYIRKILLELRSPSETAQTAPLSGPAHERRFWARLRSAATSRNQCLEKSPPYSALGCRPRACKPLQLRSKADSNPLSPPVMSCPFNCCKV